MIKKLAVNLDRCGQLSGQILYFKFLLASYFSPKNLKSFLPTFLGRKIGGKNLKSLSLFFDPKKLGILAIIFRKKV